VKNIFDPRETALLAMDCQAGIVSVYAKPPEAFVAKASGVVKAARASGVLVVHVQVVFRPGLPEVSGRNKLFAAIKASQQHQQFFQGSSGAIHPALGPEPSDVIVAKNRVSAFSGTDLDRLLRANGINHLVMFGISTSGVVLSTLLEAHDADYRITVISDCCADLDMPLHATLLERFFPTRGDVLTSEEFVSALPQPQA
jgi:nicotinamidase-related amidase